ncbi:MAG: TraB/GumN family protein [Candidatus Aenigmatarchaeota archaeon]
MIKLLGTSHISPESIQRIKEEIGKGADCVAVELDPGRYKALKHGERGSYPSLFFKLLSWLQGRLGEKTGVVPGEEMLEAVQKAQEEDIDVYLIDRPISDTLRDFKRVGLIEKLKLFIHSFHMPRSYEFDLENVPPQELVEEAVHMLEEKTPAIYLALVEKRDEIMAMALEELSKDKNIVMAIVGAGHLPGLKRRFKERGVEFEDKTFK